MSCVVSKWYKMVTVRMPKICVTDSLALSEFD